MNSRKVRKRPGSLQKHYVLFIVLVFLETLGRFEQCTAVWAHQLSPLLYTIMAMFRIF